MPAEGSAAAAAAAAAAVAGGNDAHQTGAQRKANAWLAQHGKQGGRGGARMTQAEWHKAMALQRLTPKQREVRRPKRRAQA